MWIITERESAMALVRRSEAGWAVHPGEILREEFLQPLGISGYALAKGLGVPAQKVNDVVLKKRGISADMAIRLGRFFETTPEFWMNLQAAYELWMARKALKKTVERIHPHRAAVA